MATRKSTKRTTTTAAQAGAPAEARLVAQHRAQLPGLQTALDRAAAALGAAKVLRAGRIVVHTGSAAGGVVLEHGEGGTRLMPLEPGDTPVAPQVEVIGDPRRIAAIIRGEKDARMQFFAGGIRVRGDMAYLSEIGMKLGFLDRPLI